MSSKGEVINLEWMRGNPSEIFRSIRFHNDKIRQIENLERKLRIAQVMDIPISQMKSGSRINVYAMIKWHEDWEHRCMMGMVAVREVDYGEVKDD